MVIVEIRVSNTIVINSRRKRHLLLLVEGSTKNYDKGNHNTTEYYKEKRSSTDKEMNAIKISIVIIMCLTTKVQTQEQQKDSKEQLILYKK